MDILTFAGLAGGLVLLVAGGEFLVRGASRLAVIAGISPLVVGLTVVAAGTSSPELAVSVQASLGGNPDVSMGNVVGSNIFNTLGILGLCAIAAPLVVRSKVVRIDIPIMIAASVILALLTVFDGSLDWYDGLLLLVAFVSYVVWTVLQGRRETQDVRAEFGAEFDGRIPRSPFFLARNVLLLLTGLGVLVLGARLLVDSGVELASSLGVSDAVVGLTIIAIGTSLPEVATSVIATIRNERDIAVGNVVGSNIFNILGILGVASAIAPVGGDAALQVKDTIARFDMPVMVATAIVCLPMLFKGHLVRWEGIAFLGAYATYVAFLILTETESGARGTFAV
ncbi:MAG: calcium/sodium antiporter, partial [Dehalococcoidia bacterium]